MQDRVVWAEIDLSAIRHNFTEVKRIVSQGTKVMAVVKANGYGHGGVEVANTVLQEGANYLAVARLEEGVSLRRSNILAPILVFGPVLITQLTSVMANDLTLTIYSLEQARAYSKFAQQNKIKIKCHLKVDTGMGRLGFVITDPSKAKGSLVEILQVFELPGLWIEGIYTHFACADEEDLTYSYVQLDRFNSLIQELQKRGIRDLIFHAANSAAIIQIPDAHLDMVRPGIMIYGLYPSNYLSKQDKVHLIPAMSIKAKIAMIKQVKKGFKVSYGATYETGRESSLATIPIGYADGYPRILSSRGRILVKGKKAPIVGRVCMDQMVVDVTDIGVHMGEDVLIFGRDRYGKMSADVVAEMANTINYEIVSAITSRIPRIYIKD